MKEDIRKRIGKSIARLREKENLTMAQLADILGYSRVTVSAWERGISAPSAVTVGKIAALFGVSADEICGNAVDGEKTGLIDLRGLSWEEIKMVRSYADYLKNKNCMEKIK